jgi:hypothetical protein
MVAASAADQAVAIERSFMSRTRSSVLAVVLVAALGSTVGVSTAAGKKVVLKAKLSAKKETDQAANGRGKARITLNTKTDRVCFKIKVRRVGTMAMGHIHSGRKGVAGPVFVLLFDQPTKKPKGCVTAEKSQVRAIRRHPTRFYVNVHTQQFPAGAARGQLHRKK